MYTTKKERELLEIFEQVGIKGHNTIHVNIDELPFIDRIGQIIEILYPNNIILNACIGHLMNHPYLVIQEIERQTNLIINFRHYV